MKRYLETGNFAITEGAILAGCRFFCGYPITPATELAEAMSLRLPQVDGVYLQAEDECAAMHLCIGASLGGGAWWAVPLAVAAGIPAYLNGYAAIPTVSGLIDLGMAPAAGAQTSERHSARPAKYDRRRRTVHELPERFRFERTLGKIGV